MTAEGTVGTHTCLIWNRAFFGRRHAYHPRAIYYPLILFEYKAYV
jgi:hypothetical protein